MLVGHPHEFKKEKYSEPKLAAESLELIVVLRQFEKKVQAMKLEDPEMLEFRCSCELPAAGGEIYRQLCSSCQSIAKVAAIVGKISFIWARK